LLKDGKPVDELWATFTDDNGWRKVKTCYLSQPHGIVHKFPYVYFTLNENISVKIVVPVDMTIVPFSDLKIATFNMSSELNPTPQPITVKPGQLFYFDGYDDMRELFTCGCFIYFKIEDDKNGPFLFNYSTITDGTVTHKGDVYSSSKTLVFCPGNYTLCVFNSST
jgi:hypothetical protein